MADPMKLEVRFLRISGVFREVWRPSRSTTSLLSCMLSSAPCHRIGGSRDVDGVEVFGDQELSCEELAALCPDSVVGRARNEVVQCQAPRAGLGRHANGSFDRGVGFIVVVPRCSSFVIGAVLI